MPRAKKICSRTGCPATTTATLCTTHAREADRARGTTTERGYGKDYQAQRTAWALKVAAGTATCWRCRKPITTGAPFHLGHDDQDRSIIHGPEHPHCNLSAAGKASHQYD